MSSIRDLFEGGIYGLLIGDALGVPYEFHEPEAIPEPEQIDYQSAASRLPAGSFPRAAGYLVG